MGLFYFLEVIDMYIILIAVIVSGCVCVYIYVKFIKLYFKYCAVYCMTILPQIRH